MFGKVKAIEAEAVRSAVEGEAFIKQFGQARIRAADMIEKPNLHVSVP
jgi:hypothetical protein